MSTYSPTNVRVQHGRQALAAYQNIMVDWYPGKYKLTYEQLEKLCLGKNTDFLAQVGDAVISAKIGQRRISEAMERVVERTSITPLSIPDTFAFVDGVAREVGEFDFSLFGDAALDIALDVSKGTTRVVNTVAGAAVDTVENAGFFVKNSKWIILAVLALAGAIIWKVGSKFKASDLKLVNIGGK